MTDVELLERTIRGDAKLNHFDQERWDLVCLLEGSHLSRSAIREFHLSEGELVKLLRTIYKIGKYQGASQAEEAFYSVGE